MFLLAAFAGCSEKNGDESDDSCPWHRAECAPLGNELTDYYPETTVTHGPADTCLSMGLRVEVVAARADPDGTVGEARVRVAPVFGDRYLMHVFDGQSADSCLVQIDGEDVFTLQSRSVDSGPVAATFTLSFYLGKLSDGCVVDAATGDGIERQDAYACSFKFDVEIPPG